MAYGLASLVPRPFGGEGLGDEACGLACLVDVGGGGGGGGVGEWGSGGGVVLNSGYQAVVSEPDP